jgi:hypothetical protein
MKRSQSFTGIKLNSILMLIISMSAYSQTDTLGSLQKTDTLKLDSVVSRHALYTGIGYGSNMIYMGSTISHNQPFGYTALSYGFNNEFFATISAIHLSDVKPFAVFYTGSLNYNHVFNSWFDISTGVYRYQVTKSLADTILANFTYGDLTVGIDWRLIYSKISVGALFSNDNQAFLKIKNSRYFQTAEFSKNKSYFSFDPYVNLLAGPRYKVETTAETYLATARTYQNLGSNSQNSISNNSASSYITTTNTTYSMDFGLMEIDFGLPVTFSSNRVAIEAEVNYVLPLYNDSYFPGPKGFVFIISGIFRIF